MPNKLAPVRQGRPLYYGRAASADEYFSALGFPLPYRINAADHILDLASADISTPARHAAPLHVPGVCVQRTHRNLERGVPLAVETRKLIYKP